MVVIQTSRPSQVLLLAGTAPALDRDALGRCADLAQDGRAQRQIGGGQVLVQVPQLARPGSGTIHGFSTTSHAIVGCAAV
jgi:hypothetical protein